MFAGVQGTLQNHPDNIRFVDYFRSMFSNKKKKRFSPEKIADLYLKGLIRSNGEILFLNAFLVQETIFHDIDILNQVRAILEKGGYVEKDKAGGFSVFTYNAPGTPFQEITGEIATIPQYSITDKGRRLIDGGQELDVEGRAAREAESKKWKERLITSGIALAVSIITMTVKWFLFDRK